MSLTVITTAVPSHDLRVGDLVDYGGEPHRVTHIDCRDGWAWPIAFDDAGWAMALGHDVVVIRRQRSTRRRP